MCSMLQVESDIESDTSVFDVKSPTRDSSPGVGTGRRRSCTSTNNNNNGGSGGSEGGGAVATISCPTSTETMTPTLKAVRSSSENQSNVLDSPESVA